MTNWRVLAGVVLFLGLSGVLTVSLLYSMTGGDIPFDHGIVVDAGSTKSEVTLYKWNGDKYNGTGCVTELGSCKTKAGLSSFEDPMEAARSLTECFNKVSEKIPEGKRKTSPVYLPATAGMRLTNISDYYQNVAIFTAVKCVLELSGLDVRFVGIIDGMSEGLFAWTTTNFLKDILQKGKHPSVGALDMGGASTQIAFEVPPGLNSTPNVVPMQMYGEEYHVYSNSYLCYGIDQAYRRYLNIIADNPDRTDSIAHPCAPKGLERVHTASFLFDHPCTRTREYKIWVTTYPEKLSNNYTFVGTGDVAACKLLMPRLYAESCKFDNNCFRPVDSSLMPKDFVAFSTYFYTTSFFNSTKTSFDNFTEAVDGFCALDWQIAETIETPGADSSFNYRYCFQGQAVSHLLIEGYGFNASTWSNIEFTGKVNRISLGWSLGYMINATNAIPAEKANPPIISLAVFIVVLLISVVLCLLFVVFFSFHWRNRNKNMKSSSVAA